MALNFRKFYKGINIVPKIGSTSNSQGDLEVDSSTTRLNYHNGTINSPVMTDDSPFTNRTIDNTNTIFVKDTNFTIEDDVDTTKRFKFQASGISAGTTRTLTIQDSNFTIVGRDTLDVLTNKDIDGGAASNTHRITLPTGTLAAITSLTRKEGTIWYATDTDIVYKDDGATLTPIGTGGAGTPIIAQDEGITLTANMNLINFVGAGVTASNVGQAVTVTIPGSSTPTGTVNTLAFFNGSGNLSSNVNFGLDETFARIKLGFTSGSATFISSGVGSFAYGSAQTDGTVSSSSTGSLAGGNVSGTGCLINANANGSIALGTASGTSNQIIANGAGSLALGNTTVSSGGLIITAVGAPGSISLGYASNGQISTTAPGAMAIGAAVLNNISAGGQGSFIGGDTGTGSIISSGRGSFGYGDNFTLDGHYAQALGSGHANTSDYSITIGTFSNSSGTPGAPTNADTLFAVGNGANAGARNNAFEITRAGHLRSDQFTIPASTPNANAGAGATCTVAGSTDTRGEIVLTTGTGAVAGMQLTVTFNVPYAVTPICVLSPSDSDAVSVNTDVFLTTSTTTITLTSIGGLADSTEYRWTFFIIE